MIEDDCAAGGQVDDRTIDPLGLTVTLSRRRLPEIQDAKQRCGELTDGEAAPFERELASPWVSLAN